MLKLGVFSGEEICRILETEGFLRVRQKASHTILQKRTEHTTITVPVPMHRTIRIGTLQSIIRDQWIGWGAEVKASRLYHVMDAYVLGAVPPYSQLLGGKLIALAAASDEVRMVFWDRYLGRPAIISGATLRRPDTRAAHAICWPGHFAISAAPRQQNKALLLSIRPCTP